MNILKQKILPLISLTWIFLIACILFRFYEPSVLPAAVLEKLSNNNTPALIFASIFLAFFFLTSIKILRSETKNLKLYFLVSILTLLIYRGLNGTEVIVHWMSFFDDGLIILLGFIFGLLFTPLDNFQSDSCSQINSFKYIRIIIIITLFSFIGIFFISEELPLEFKEFVKDPLSQQFNNFFLSVSILPVLGIVVSLIGIIFRRIWAKHMFLITSLGVLLLDTFPRDALTAASAVLGFSYIFLTGILLAIIYCSSIADKFVYGYKRPQKINIFRTLGLVCFSKKFYTEILVEWKGIGFVYLLTITFFVSLLKVAPHLSPYMEQPTDVIVKEIPIIYYENGLMSINKSLPYIVYNKSKHPLIIFTKSDDLKQNQIKPWSIVVTPHNAYLYVKKPILISYFLGSKNKIIQPKHFLEFSMAVTGFYCFLEFLFTWIGLIFFYLLLSFIFSMIRLKFKKYPPEFNLTKSMRLTLVQLSPYLLIFFTGLFANQTLRLALLLILGAIQRSTFLKELIEWRKDLA